MKENNKITQDVLIERLGKRLDYPVTNAHFAVLVHGWAKKHPEQAPSIHTRIARKRVSGELWFTLGEVIRLSAYAGYDLTKD